MSPIRVNNDALRFVSYIIDTSKHGVETKRFSISTEEQLGLFTPDLTSAWIIGVVSKIVTYYEVDIIKFLMESDSLDHILVNKIQCGS